MTVAAGETVLRQTVVATGEGRAFFNDAAGWYAALVWSWLAGRVCHAVKPMPASAPSRSYELLLCARKPE